MSDLYADADRPPVLLIATAHDRTHLAEAIHAAGGRVSAQVDWIAGATRGQSVSLIVAAAADVPDAPLAAILAELAAIGDLGDSEIIVTLTKSQIDQVSTALLGPQIELLCEPDAAALAGSVALALVKRHDVLADNVREGEAERLRRLNDEIARIADVLARLTRHADHRPGGVADRAPPYGSPPSTVAISGSDVRKAIRARRLRELQFPDGLFEDPAWDMLLDLYAAELEGAQVSVSSLCIAAAVAPTTALRWIARMTESGLFIRQPDPFDRRRAFMALSDDARDRMQRYFGALAHQGLAIA